MNGYLPVDAAKFLYKKYCESNKEDEQNDLINMLSSHDIEVNFMFQLFVTKKPTKDQKELVFNLLTDYLTTRESNNDLRQTVFRELVKLKYKKEQLALLIIDEIYRYKRNKNFDIWSLCDYLYCLSVKSLKNEYIKIASDKEFAEGRQMLFLKFGAFKDIDYLSVMLDNIDDPNVNGHIISALASYPDSTLDKYFVPFLADPRKWVRKVAEKRLENQSGRGNQGTVSVKHSREADKKRQQQITNQGITNQGTVL